MVDKHKVVKKDSRNVENIQNGWPLDERKHLHAQMNIFSICNIWYNWNVACCCCFAVQFCYTLMVKLYIFF